jgi:hypothetical protein
MAMTLLFAVLVAFAVALGASAATWWLLGHWSSLMNWLLGPFRQWTGIDAEERTRR